MYSCKHYLKTKANNYQGTLLQRDDRSKNIYVCHQCWSVFLVEKNKTKSNKPTLTRIEKGKFIDID